MKIHVHYTGPLRSAIGLGTEELEIVGAEGLSSVIDAIRKRHGADAVTVLVDSSGALRRELLFAINDQQVRRDAMPTLEDGDRITILHPISGG